MMLATSASNWSRSRVRVVAAATSRRKSSSSLLSLKRTAALRGSGSGGLDNLDAGAGADACGAGGGHSPKVVQAANAARRFHSHLGSDRGAHERDIVRGGGGGGAPGRDSRTRWRSCIGAPRGRPW